MSTTDALEAAIRAYLVDPTPDRRTALAEAMERAR